PCKIPTRSSSSRWKSANAGRRVCRHATGRGCKPSPTTPSAARCSAPTRSASRSRRRVTPVPTDGCCGTRATFTRPMRSSQKRLSGGVVPPHASRGEVSAQRTEGSWAASMTLMTPPALRATSPAKLGRKGASATLRLLLIGLLCQAAVACATPPAPAAAAPPTAVSSGQTAEAISNIMNEEIAAGHLVGGVVVLGIDGRIVLRRAYGQRSVMPDVKPATLDTIYDAASLTKVMATAIAIMQLSEHGQINLDQPVAAYWP